MRFSDLRVLDFCWVGAGAFVTRLLADLGAEVIKVESHAHPDNLRLSGPHKSGARHLEGSGYFASRNTNKKSIALNMGRPEARALAKQLAQKCSVVTNNFRPGIMERWGLGYAELAAADPSLIYLAMPMQGSFGPHKSYIGFGSALEASSRLAGMLGSPEGAARDNISSWRSSNRRSISWGPASCAIRPPARCRTAPAIGATARCLAGYLG